jgi:hypothetical protein
MFESCVTAIDSLDEAGKRLKTLSVTSRVPHSLDTQGGVQAFTVKGSSRVCLTMRDGKRDLIGSERRKELLRALQPSGIPG